MRLVFGFVLMLGIALAGFAVYMARGYMSEYQSELAKERAAREAIVPTVPVYVVNRQIGYGESITKEDVRLVDWPETAIPEGAFQKPVLTIEEFDALVAEGKKPVDPMFPEGENVLRVAVRTMEKDEPILAVKVTEPGEDAGVSSRLTAGMRAFAIRVDVASGVSGFLRPGDKVDVYWTGSVTNGPVHGDVTKLIQSNVRLVAVDQIADKERQSPTIARTVTVEVSPQQVAALAQAQSTGNLSLALVGASDNTVAEAVEVDQASLLGLQAAPIVQQEVERVCTIKTRRGAEIVETPIACTD